MSLLRAFEKSMDERFQLEMKKLDELHEFQRVQLDKIGQEFQDKMSEYLLQNKLFLQAQLDKLHNINNESDTKSKKHP